MKKCVYAVQKENVIAPQQYQRGYYDPPLESLGLTLEIRGVFEICVPTRHLTKKAISPAAKDFNAILFFYR